MSSDRPASGKRELALPLGIIISIVTAGATIVSRFSALEEAKQIAVENIRDLQNRVGAIERNNALLERIHVLEKQNAEIHTELVNMRDELRELRGKRR